MPAAHCHNSESIGASSGLGMIRCPRMRVALPLSAALVTAFQILTALRDDSGSRAVECSPVADRGTESVCLCIISILYAIHA